MASQYLARLGIVLGIDSGELQQGITEAQKTFHNFKNQVQKDTTAAVREFEALKNATEDYGKTLTKVEQIQREIDRGRFMFASQNVKDKLLEQAKAYDAQAASMKKVSGAMSQQQKLQVTYQVTDFVTQIASGQNAMIAFIQQGGQLKDSMGGVGNAVRAVASIFTPFRLIVGGVAGAFATLGYAIYKGKDELDKFRDAMTLTGQFAGISYAQFVGLGDAISKNLGVAIGDTRDVLSQLVASGKFTSKSIDAVSSAILKFSQVSGVDAKEAVSKLMPLFDGTANSAKQLNDRYHFLTIEQYKYIEALERQGKLQEAAKVTAQALSDSLDSTKRNLGYLETAWKNVTSWASKAWDAMLGLGREDGFDRAKELETKINQMEAWLEKRRDKLPAADLKAREAQIKAMRDELNTLVTRLGNEMSAAELRSGAGQDNDRKINLWTKAGGLAGLKKASEEAAKAEADARYKVRLESANEEMRIEIELAHKIALAKQEEQKKNEETYGQYANEYAKLRAAKVNEAEAEAEKKRAEFRKKEAKKDFDEKARVFDQENNVIERLARERDKIMFDAEAKRQEQEFARQELEAKYSLIGASQKEIEVMKAKIDAQRELQRLMATKEFQSMSEADQTKAKKIYEDTMQAKIANIELAESLQRVQGMYDAVWSNMSSAIESFVRTGKLSIKDFTKSVIQDMLIMQMKLQAMALIRGLLGSFFATNVGANGASGVGTGVTGFGSAYADGGNPTPNTINLVGERGPELFIPRTAGTIIPNDKIGNLGSTTNVTNNYINAIDTKSFEQRLLESNQAIWSANQYATKNLSTNFGRT